MAQPRKPHNGLTHSLAVSLRVLRFLHHNKVRVLQLDIVPEPLNAEVARILQSSASTPAFYFKMETEVQREQPRCLRMDLKCCTVFLPCRSLVLPFHFFLPFSLLFLKCILNSTCVFY